MYRFLPYSAASVSIVPQSTFQLAVVRFITNLSDDMAGIFNDIVHVTHIVLPAK